MQKNRSKRTPVRKDRPPAVTGRRRPTARSAARRAAKPLGPRRPRLPKGTTQSVIFDVEGTLVDCAIQTTECWRLVLQASGYEFSHNALHRYSGMDTDDMLAVLLPAAGKNEKESLKREQGKL